MRAREMARLGPTRSWQSAVELSRRSAAVAAQQLGPGLGFNLSLAPVLVVGQDGEDDRYDTSDEPRR